MRKPPRLTCARPPDTDSKAPAQLAARDLDLVAGAWLRPARLSRVNKRRPPWRALLLADAGCAARHRLRRLGGQLPVADGPRRGMRWPLRGAARPKRRGAELIRQRRFFCTARLLRELLVARRPGGLERQCARSRRLLRELLVAPPLVLERARHQLPRSTPAVRARARRRRRRGRRGAQPPSRARARRDAALDQAVAGRGSPDQKSTAATRRGTGTRTP